VRSFLGFTLVILCFCIPSVRADIIDFESLSDLESVTNQFPGLTFTNTTVVTAGISVNELELPPHSGIHEVFDDGGPISIAFSGPVLSFGGYFTYLEPLTLTAFDAASNLVSSAASAYSTNDVLFGDSGSSPNEFLQVSFAGGISRVVIAGDPLGTSFTMDDVTYTPASTPVPEPASFVFLLTAAVAMFAARGRHPFSPPRR
jgi:hypothetical protein